MSLSVFYNSHVINCTADYDYEQTSQQIVSATCFTVGQTSEWDMLHVASSKSLGVQLPVLINRRPTAMCQLRADFTKCFPYSLQFCVPFDLGMWPI